jgi:hypothetical protein
MVGERGFEPPAPASRRHWSCCHRPHFRCYTAHEAVTGCALFSFESRSRFSARPSAPVCGGAVIYHGTPMTPRVALLDVCAGRAMCVSYWRPDDVEAVEAISPAIMFRQRCLFRVAGSAEARRGMVHPAGLDRLFRVAGTAPVSAGSVGGDARCAGSAKPAQRCASVGVAIWGARGTALPHGRANREAVATVRETPARLPGLDRRGQASGPARVSCSHGRDRCGARQPLAGSAHDARDRGGRDVPLRQRRRDHSSSERMEV